MLEIAEEFLCEQALTNLLLAWFISGVQRKPQKVLMSLAQLLKALQCKFNF
jgi:hypothetical protein